MADEKGYALIAIVAVVAIVGLLAVMFRPAGSAATTAKNSDLASATGEAKAALSYRNQVTYQGVIDMLGACWDREWSGPASQMYSKCNELCSDVDKTCISSFYEFWGIIPDYTDVKSVGTYPCNGGGAFGGEVTLHCKCCEPAQEVYG